MEHAVASEQELLARCRTGDEAAFRALHRAHYGFVFRLARRLGTPPAELDDVCQDVFLVAFSKLGSFTHGQLSTWLYRIVATVVSSRHRRRRVRDTLFGWFSRDEADRVVDQTPEREAHGRQVESQVAKVLERMAPKKREVFVLFELEGMAGEQIAELVGCSVPTVWSRLHYARKEFEALAREQGLVP